MRHFFAWVILIFLVGQVAAQDSEEWVIETIDGVEMVFVPAGCFEMGHEPEFDEIPVHEQCFEDGFWLDRFEVSNAQFEEFEGVAAEDSRFSEPDFPRQRVTWWEARDFCQDKRGGRLPTEAEWEYAARGSEGRLFPWGDEMQPDYTVFVGNSKSSPAAIGSFPEGVSWVGALDMGGNVAEWVSSIYDPAVFPYPFDPTDGREDPERHDLRRSLRGGSYLSAEVEIASYNRAGAYPEYANGDYGFRCLFEMETE